MKIKRFVARSMREAIRLVRDEQGPDAVILSNRRVSGGVEVVAATDYDAALMQQAVRIAAGELSQPERPAEPAAAPRAAAPATPVAPPRSSAVRPSAATRPRAESPARPAPAAAPAMPTPRPQAGARAANVAATAATSAAPMPAQSVPSAAATRATPRPAPQPEFVQLQQELGGMRKLLEEQLASLVWRDMSDRAPERMAAVRAMASLALDPQLTRDILGELPDKPGAERARFLPLGLLSRRIPVTPTDLVLDGGILALVGPTGVGKTTTIAKLAARFADRHGTRDIALVTTDHFRVGAQEQLYTYGRLLGVPVHCAANAAELAATLAKLADRKLVLIDTAGMSPRDARLAAQFQTLAGASAAVKTLLVLSATTQAGDLEEIARRFADVKPSACIVTKIDEASRIGGVVSTVIRRALPIAYLTDGQRVPEDIRLARADQIVLRAMQLARQSPAVPDDTTLALQFGAAHVRA